MGYSNLGNRISILVMPSLYFPFTLRLYGHVLWCLRDHNFTGLDLFYRIKDCWKHRDTPHDLLLRPLERGLAFKIGEWCYATMFDGMSESMRYIEELGPEERLWFLDDVVEAAELSGLFDNEESLQGIARLIKEIDSSYDLNDLEMERKYFNALEGRGRRKLISLFEKFCERVPERISEMGHDYALEVADRILHDRQLCNFIARTVMDIGFDGETVEGLRKQWVQRERWPSTVRSILLARDRGKCASCGIDIVQELREAGHIDHMFPIARGGCNDVVNLQLLCSKCNLTKAVESTEVANSVPRYIRRRTTKTPTSPAPGERRRVP
jgi:hypothetical protein